MRPNFKNINIRTDAFTHSGHAELQNNNAGRKPEGLFTNVPKVETFSDKQKREAMLSCFPFIIALNTYSALSSGIP